MKKIAYFTYTHFFVFAVLTTITTFLPFKITHSQTVNSLTKINFGNSNQTTLPGCPANFKTEMRLGTKGPGVLALQKILNADERTKIANSGLGSPGQETNTFGKATEDAVKRFQQLFVEYTGKPNGTVSGGTLSVLTVLCNKQSKIKLEMVNIDNPELKIELKADTTNLQKNMKINLVSNKIIQKPGIDAFICDRCRVSDVRKLSQTTYTIIFSPINDTVKNAEIQVEAGKIKDLNNESNSSASNVLNFKLAPVINFELPKPAATTIIDTTAGLVQGLVSVPDNIQTETYASIATDQANYNMDNIMSMVWFVDPSVFSSKSTGQPSSGTPPCILDGGPYNKIRVQNIGTKLIKVQDVFSKIKNFSQRSDRTPIGTATFSISCELNGVTASSSVSITIEPTTNSGIGVIDTTYSKNQPSNTN